MKPARISFYGNFGAGNLGNECTLQAVIEQTRRRWPDAQLMCFCTNPQDVRKRHNIAAFPSEAVDRSAAERFRSSWPWARLERIFRIAFRRIPRELVHWGKSLRAVGRTDMLIVAGTGIVADYLSGPLGWPYDIFKLSTLAALCRVKLVFLSVGVGPIRHPLSRWFLKSSLALAQHRSYRDEASKQYMEKIGFDTNRDCVCPDVVFGLSQANLASGVRAGPGRTVGLGLKDYGLTEPNAFREYLDTMVAFVSWLQGLGYSVRLLIGDVQYDTSVIEEFVDLLKNRNIPTDAPLLIVEPALTVKELLRQIGETEAVISARYHNLVMALIQNKPVITLSDHAKLDSLAADFGLAQYLVPLANLSPDVLIDRFRQLENDVERLRPHIKAELEKYCQALDALYATLLASDAKARAKSGFMTKIAESLVRRRSPINLYIRLNRWLWKRLPSELRNTRPLRWYGTILHQLVSRRANRRQFTGTFFFRNRPELELMRRLAGQRPHGSTLNIAVLGCSIGAEIYSILSTIRTARPDLSVCMCAVDNSAEALQVAKEAVYTTQICDFVGEPIFERMTEAEFRQMFEGDRREASIRSWMREGISWHLHDAGDPALMCVLGAQDMVVASNFLCHMDPSEAENCLRNISGMVKSGGYLFVTGVDLDIREKVARDLRWRPVPELIEEIHDGDPSVRRDWPWAWWGLEPLDTKRADWQMRYAAVFRPTAGD
jgi:polysaccharide pyruvyl transferase WcaK-like protein/chemotaxis methyl-accepting protein methylase